MECVSDCCLTPIQLYHGENKLLLQWDDDEVCFVLDQHAELEFYSASSLKQQLRVDMSLHSDTLFWFRANQSLLFLRMFREEATNTNFIVFGLTRPGLEPNIYHTRGENANHYTTDVVYCIWKVAGINWGFDGCICSFTWQHVAEPVKQISAIKSWIKASKWHKHCEIISTCSLQAWRNV